MVVVCSSMYGDDGVNVGIAVPSWAKLSRYVCACVYVCVRVPSELSRRAESECIATLVT